MEQPRYSISLLPDDTVSSAMTMMTLNLCERLAQGYMLTPEVIPHLPLVEFHAPNDQAAHALFNRWSTRQNSVTVTPTDLNYGRETRHHVNNELLSNMRLLLFCDPTDELASLQTAFEQMASQRPYKLILPDDDDDFPAFKLADLRDADFGEISIRQSFADLFFRPHSMTPALGRCDEQGHMVKVLAPTTPLRAN